MSNLFRRFAPLVSLAGTVVLLAGLSLDAVQHRVNPEAAHGGGIASLFNPAHSIPAIRIALCVTGALLWLLGRAGGSGVSLLERTAFVGTAGVVMLLAFSEPPLVRVGALER